MPALPGRVFRTPWFYEDVVYALTPIVQALGLKILLRCSMTEFHKDFLPGEDTIASSAVVPSVTLGYLTGMKA